MAFSCRDAPRSKRLSLLCEAHPHPHASIGTTYPHSISVSSIQGVSKKSCSGCSPAEGTSAARIPNSVTAKALLPVKRHYLSSVDRSALVSRNRADITPQQTVLAIASTQNASRVPHGVIDHFEIRHPITYHFTKFHFLRQWRLVERRLRVYITSIAHLINVTIRKR